MKDIIIICFILVGATNVFCQENNSPLLDSLLQVYSKEELQNMGSQEMINVIREIRGQELIDFPSSKTIKGIVGNIENEKKQINTFVHWVKSKLSTARVEVFPNSHVDLLNAFTDGFYSDLITRELSHSNYANIEIAYGYEEGFSMAYSVNNARREYHFIDKDLVLIKVIIGINVNEGEKAKVDGSGYNLLDYEKFDFYLRNDSLIKVEFTKAIQLNPKDIYLITQDDLNNTPVSFEYKEFYYHEDRCFVDYRFSDKVDLSEWKKGIGEINLVQWNGPNNQFPLIVRNYMAEYKEFINGINDYIAPSFSSGLQPYIIPEK